MFLAWFNQKLHKEAQLEWPVEPNKICIKFTLQKIGSLRGPEIMLAIKIIFWVANLISFNPKCQ